MGNSYHFLLPAGIPTFTLHLAALLGFYLWGRLYWTAVYPHGRRPALGGVAARILAGFAALTLAAQGLQRHFIFATPWPIWPILLAGASLVELVVFLYQPEQDNLKPRRIARLLTTARVLLILALIFMLCQPVRAWTRDRTVRRQLAVLVDISPSMNVPDNSATPAEKLRLAYLLALTNVPRPSPLVEQALRLKPIQQQLDAQADSLAILSGDSDEALRKELRKRKHDLDKALSAAQREVTKQTNDLAAIMRGKTNKESAVLFATLAQYSALFATNAQPALTNLEEQIRGTIKDREATNVAIQVKAIANNFRSAAAALMVMEPRLNNIAEKFDDALYASLPEKDRQAIDQLANKKRMELAGELLCRKAHIWDDREDVLLDYLQKTYGLRLYAFSSRPVETEEKKLIKLIGDTVIRPLTNSIGSGTDLAAALEQAALDTPPEQLAGILLLTDGNHNTQKPVEPVARNLGLKSVPVCSVMIGNNRRPPVDAAIVSLEAPAAVSTNDRVNIVAQLKLDGLAQTALTVNLYRENVLVSTQLVTAASPAFRSRLYLADTPQTNGLTMYKVAVQCLTNDVLPLNNSGEAPVFVTSDQTKLLMADGWPRWEFRYLKNIFSGRDSAVRIQFIIFHPDQIDQAPPRQVIEASTARAAGETEATAWPVNEDEWMKFDVVILGDIERELLTPAELEVIKKYVLNRGGALVVVAGPMYMPRYFTQTPLAELLPVVVAPPNSLLPSGGPEEEYRLMLTDEGREDPTLRMAVDPVRNLALWSTMPNLFWRHSIQELKPGATVLAYAYPLVPPAFMRPKCEGEVPDAETLRQRRQFENENPLLVTHYAGAGRVLFLAFDQTWRFRYREGDLWHHKFWGQVLRWATADKLPFGTGSIRLGLDQWRYAPGTPVRLRARILRADNSPVANLKPVVQCVRREAEGKTGAPLNKILQPESDRPGSYSANLGEFPEGRYAVTLDPAQTPGLAGLALQPVTAEFAVQPADSSELVNLAADRGLLARLADLTGGRAVDPPRTRDALEKLAPPTVKITEHRQYNLWTSWPLLAIIVAFAALEWITRKQKGLP